ncbi:MAG: type II 3-dehydroquinate dehydratase [Alphaproteobacteria bacterium]|jgi:3-dehydroquinate dehydratase-2|nr:type II 3-dehydroquinate dehydratase [Alphaproteobacteria bacterium]MDP7222138.1 type II 3-dehydroquinate dehydratase [Alphaproteobacteria bacterium]
MHNRILILNGPNLNMLGKREPEIYGDQTLDDIRHACGVAADTHGFMLDFKQSNYEGELVTWIQEALGQVRAIIINAAAYTHTSVAIHDALKLHSVPIIEVHLSNPQDREDFRHFSYIEPIAEKAFVGQGLQGYVSAIDYLSTVLQ